MCTNVLIVEEEPVATALQRTLIACGFCALVVSDLAEAKKLMTTVIPDLVIFGSALSDPWDRMFGRGLAADDRTRNIPQLLLSKSDMPEAISKFRSEARRAGRPGHPLRIVFELQQFLTDDVTMCLDMGSFHLWLARHLYSFKARQVLISNGQQTLGVALPWAIAATLVRPHEKVLSISGDGGFLFSAMELETAVRLKSNLVHMIWIDGTYDMVGVQEEQKYGRPSGTSFGPVDVVKYAEAFGAVGFMIEVPDQIG